jgi:hypothetical protein
MHLINRRTVLRVAGSFAFTSVLPSSVLASRDAQTIFMLDAINDIRAKIGLPTGQIKIEVDTEPGTKKDRESRNNDPRQRPPEKKHPERWGGVCVPVPFAGFDFYYTDGQIYWFPNEGQKLPEVTVPHGFCCDLTSIPQFFWSFGLPRTGRYAYAAIVHDYLYWDQTLSSRQQANEILYAAMLDSGVSGITREVINLGVSKIPYFSKDAWDKNTAAKKAGAKRILKVFPPRDKIVSWADWSKDLSHFSD